MNSLVGMGAMASFTAGAVSTLVPGAGFDASFLEEPVMLLAFVLLGRSLESHARLQASGEWRLPVLLCTCTCTCTCSQAHAPTAHAVMRPVHADGKYAQFLSVARFMILHAALLLLFKVRLS